VSITSDRIERIDHSAVASYPGVENRLLAGVDARESLAAYLGTGGYLPLGDPRTLAAGVEAADLRGRGGAAFPLARKLAAVSASSAGGSSPVVVANGEEGEPASVKDRWLLRYRPHLVLDGLRLAAGIVGAGEVHGYVSDPESADSVRAAAAELAGAGLWDVDLTVTVVAPGYVAGEETALVRAVNGGPALPTDKPPRPFEAGIGGRPTLVSNVETLAGLPLLHRLGVAAYAGSGGPGESGAGETFLLTLSGCAAAGLYEVPFGVTLREVLAWRGEDAGDVAGFVMGGYFGGLLGPRASDLPLDYDALRLAGSGLGCAAIAVVPPADCPLRLASALMTYFALENAGQCGSCFNGTAAMRVVLDGLREHRAGQPEVERLRHLSGFLPGRGACGTLDGAANVGASLLREFPEVVAAHVDGRCETCSSAVDLPGPPFAVEPPSAR
jgi:NADH:ubiquinone oxidoreductase subunit F (NADH-binding)